MNEAAVLSMTARWFETLREGTATAAMETSARVGANALSLYQPLAAILALLFIAGLLWGIKANLFEAFKWLLKLSLIGAILSPSGPYDRLAQASLAAPDGFVKMAAPRVAAKGIANLVDESQAHTERLAQAFRDQDKSTFPISISRLGWETAATTVAGIGAAADAVAVVLFSLGMVGLGLMAGWGKFMSLALFFPWSRQMASQYFGQTFGYWLLFGLVSGTYGILFALQSTVKDWALSNAVSGWGAAMWVLLFGLVNIGLLAIVGMKSQHLAGGIQITTMGAITSAVRLARNAANRTMGGAGCNETGESPRAPAVPSRGRCVAARDPSVRTELGFLRRQDVID